RILCLVVDLIKVFAIIGHLVDRRIGRGRDLHQVQSPFARQAHSFEGLHHAELRAFLVYHPHFARSDPLIHARTVAHPEISFSDNSPFAVTPITAGRRFATGLHRRTRPTPFEPAAHT